MHTHASHITLGYVTDGEISVNYASNVRFYHVGELFFIMPDVSHTIETVNNKPYSMISICIPFDKMANEAIGNLGYLGRLKAIIMDAPENIFFIEDMARNIGVSPYHMIRRFKNVCGLTPHQFQIQCRVRKAQRLLEEGRSVTEVAYATGFCDQSHFDRCFRKIVRLTPSEYKLAVKKLA